MSYDICFKVKVEGTDKYVTVGDCYANITYNVRELIKQATGLPWKNGENNGFCKDIIPVIARGWTELLLCPEKYKQYESPNGWGTVQGTKAFFEYIVHSWERFCEDYDQDIVDAATFWIE